MGAGGHHEALSRPSLALVEEEVLRGLNLGPDLPSHIGLSPASPPSGFHRDPTNSPKGSIPTSPLLGTSSMTGASVPSSQPLSSPAEQGAPEPQGGLQGAVN